MGEGGKVEERKEWRGKGRRERRGNVVERIIKSLQFIIQRC